MAQQSIHNASSSTPIYHEMKRRLAQVRTLYYWEKILFGVFIVGGAVLGFLTVVSFAEMLIHFGTAPRTVFFFLGIAGIALLAGWYILIPLLQKFGVVKNISEKETAEKVGDAFPEIKDRLRNILEIFDEHQHTPRYSPELIDASFSDLEIASSSLDFRRTISFETVKRFARYLSLEAVVAVILFSIPQLGFSSAAFRIAHFTEDFRPPVPFAFLVQPGNAEIVKGASVPIHISVQPLHIENPFGTEFAEAMIPTRSGPKEIHLMTREEGITAFEDITLRADSSGKFEYTLPSVKQSVAYFASAQNVESDHYLISVTDRPIVRSLRIHLTPPFYSRLPAQYLDENAGDVSALAGTTVRWEISVNKPLQKAAIVFSDSKTIALGEHNGTFSASLKLLAPAVYHIALKDREGISNNDPIDYKLDVVPDQAPTVVITDPGKNLDVTDATKLPMQFSLHDDFGFSSLRIAYRLVQSKYEKPHEEFSYVSVSLLQEQKAAGAAIPQGGFQDEDVNFNWNLSPLGLVPEDVIEYHAEVFDNDVVSGPKMGKSETYLLRLPSLEEVFADADKGQHQSIEKMDESLKQAEELKKNLDDLSREMKANQNVDWQKQKTAEELAKKYQDLQKKVDDVNQRLQSTVDQLQKNNVLSPETLQKYMELQKMFQQINSPEFQQALKRMQDAMRNVSPEQLLQAMKQVQFSEEMFRQSIERTLNLLKRIQIEQKVDEMVKRANQLQQEQEQLQKETSQLEDSLGVSLNDKSKMTPEATQKADDIAKRQEDISKQLQELQKQLADLKKRMEEFPQEMPLQEMEKSEQAANDSSLERSMQESAQQLRSRNMQQAMQAQQQANKGIQQVQKSLSEMQQQLFNNQMMETTNALRKATQNLLQLSEREEKLKNQAQSLDPNSRQFRENAQEQMNIQNDLSSVTNALMELSQKSFAVTPDMGKAIGQAMGNMNQALDALVQRNGAYATQNQQDAMTSLNKAASLTEQSLEAMQQGGSSGSAGSLLQQLARLAGEQQSINMQTEQMGQGQGQGLTQQQMEQIGRLAAQQDAVRKSLEQLNKEAEESAQHERILGDLDKIANDMQEVVKDMQQNNVNPNTIHQQQRILSRLLDAQSSMRERDYEQRRTSTAGVTPTRQSPAELQNENDANQLRNDLLKAAEEGYSKDYQELIRKYYEALSKEKTPPEP
jgi:hypothetical protein